VSASTGRDHHGVSTPVGSVEVNGHGRATCGSRAFPLLFGSKQPHRLDSDAVRDVLLRVGRLAELLPEVTELELNPVIANERECLIVDARILLRPAVHDDPLLRGVPS
jgi:hypothetical protein